MMRPSALRQAMLALLALRLVRKAITTAALAWVAAALVISSHTRAAEESATASANTAREQAAPAQTPQVCRTFRVREQDQIWVISTRHLGCLSGKIPDVPFKVWRYEKARWQPATTAEFYAADSAELVTPFYIHGNRIDHAEAFSDGLDVYFQLVGKLDEEPPVRFVIWSWPSDQIRGPLNDVRTKAARSDVDAYYLARFLAPMQPDVRVGLVGFSLGARIIVGALDLLGGGTQLDYTVEPGPRPAIRVAFWAAAGHNYWMLPGHYHEKALSQAERWFITINCCDPVLAHYRLLDKCSNPVALGYAGISNRSLLPPELNDRIEEVNVSNIVGSSHSMRCYLYSLYIQNRTRDYALWHELGEMSSANTATLTAAK